MKTQTALKRRLKITTQSDQLEYLLAEADIKSTNVAHVNRGTCKSGPGEGCWVCPSSFHLRGGNTPHAAPRGPKTLQPGGVPSHHSHKGTVGKGAGSMGHSAREAAPKEPVISHRRRNAGCLTFSSSGRKGNLERKGTQVERHNQRNHLSSPLSLDCEVSFVFFFKQVGEMIYL